MKKVLVSLAVILAVVVPVAGAAATTKPSVVSFKVTPTTRMATGGVVTLFASVRHATHCTFTVKPPVNGLPVTLACSSNKASKRVALPRNTSTLTKSYAFSLKASGSGGSTTAKAVIVKVLSAPSISSFAATPKMLTPAGGTITLAASVKNATSCRFSATPAVKGLPATVRCASNTAVEKVTLPANVSASMQSYAFSIKATGPGGSRSAKPERGAVLPFWSAPQSVDPVGAGLDSLSCASSSFCVTLDGSGIELSWNGQSWSTPQSLDASSFYGLTSVSCVPASTSFCAAVDGNGNVLMWNGKGWSAPLSLESNNTIGDGLTSASCPSASFCATVDGSGNVFMWNGKTWSGADEIDAFGGLTSVSCESSSFCAAVGGFYVVTWNGKTWAAPVSIDRGGLISISCATTSFCVALDDRGSVETWNGKSWSAPRVIDSPRYTILGGPSSVSCPSASFCVVVDLSDNAIAWNGKSWSTPQAIEPLYSGGGLSSASCPTSSFCAAVDGRGDAIIGRSRISAPRLPPPQLPQRPGTS
jgi:hypothetical protein